MSRLSDLAAPSEQVHSYSRLSKSFDRRQSKLDLNRRRKPRKRVLEHSFSVGTRGALTSYIDGGSTPSIKDAYLCVLKRVLAREETLFELRRGIELCTHSYWRYASLVVEKRDQARIEDEVDEAFYRESQRLKSDVKSCQQRLATVVRQMRAETYALIAETAEWRREHAKQGHCSVPYLVYQGENYLSKLRRDVSDMFIGIVRVWTGFTPDCLLTPHADCPPYPLWKRTYHKAYLAWEESRAEACSTEDALEDRTGDKLDWRSLMAISDGAWDLASPPSAFWSNPTLRASVVEACIGLDDVFPHSLIGKLSDEQQSKQQTYLRYLESEWAAMDGLEQQRRRGASVREELSALSQGVPGSLSDEAAGVRRQEALRIRQTQQSLPPLAPQLYCPSTTSKPSHSPSSAFLTSVPAADSSVAHASLSDLSVVMARVKDRQRFASRDENNQLILDQSALFRLRPSRLSVRNEAVQVMQRMFRVAHAERTVASLREDRLALLRKVVRVQRAIRAFLFRVHLTRNVTGRKFHLLRTRNMYRMKNRAVITLVRFLRRCKWVPVSSETRPRFSSKRADAVVDKVRKMRDLLDASLVNLSAEQQGHSRSRSTTPHTKRKPVASPSRPDEEERRFKSVLLDDESMLPAINDRIAPSVGSPGSFLRSVLVDESRESSTSRSNLRFELPTDSVYRSRLIPIPLKHKLSVNTDRVFVVDAPTIDTSTLLAQVKSKVYLSPVKTFAARSTPVSSVSDAAKSEKLSPHLKARLRDLLGVFDDE